nr:hypothetical protein [Tanacetum cinerariifolium]
MSTDVARGHGGDGGGDDRPPPHQIGGGCRGKGTRKHNLKTQPGRQESQQAEYPQGNQEPRVKEDHESIWPTDRPGVPDALPFLAQHLGGAEGGGHGKDWGLTTWKALDPDVPRTSQWQIGMRRLPFGLIPRTLPGRGHIPGVGRVLTGRGRDFLVSPEPRCTHTADVDEVKRTSKKLKKQMDMIMKVVRSDDKMSQLLTQLQSHHEVGSGSRSGGSRDDEPGDDEDTDEEEEDEEDGDS